MCGEAGRPSFFGKKSFCLSLKKTQRISDPVVSKALSLFLREVGFDLVTQSCRPRRASPPSAYCWWLDSESGEEGAEEETGSASCC